MERDCSAARNPDPESSIFDTSSSGAADSSESAVDPGIHVQVPDVGACDTDTESTVCNPGTSGVADDSDPAALSFGFGCVEISELEFAVIG